MTDPDRWTTAEGIRRAVRRRWDDGSLLRAWVGGAPLAPFDIPLRGPAAADLGEHYSRAQAWAEALRRDSRDGRRYRLVEGSIGGQKAGRTALPLRAVVDDFPQAWSLLSVDREASAFARVAAAEGPMRARDWALAHPLAAITVADEWPRILAAVRWLEANRGSERYLREVTAPDVDTKFLERHRGVLAAMFGTSAKGLVRALGLADKPATVRMRFDPAVFGFPSAIAEATLRLDEVRELRVSPSRVLIVENEISYLSVPVPSGGAVIWGRGYGVDEPASLEWLAGSDIAYWGDIDTHGFAILNRARAHLPQLRSVLMDRGTLLAHEERWGAESAPISSVLSELDADEGALYRDLVEGRYAPALRLEQERIAWDRVQAALADLWS